MEKKFEDIQNSDFPDIEPAKFQEWKKAGISYRKNSSRAIIISIISFIALIPISTVILVKFGLNAKNFSVSFQVFVALGFVLIFLFLFTGIAKFAEGIAPKIGRKYFRLSEQSGITEKIVEGILSGKKLESLIKEEQLEEEYDFGEKWSVDVDNLFSSGFSKEKSGDFNGAIGDYGKALEIKPNDFQLLYVRGDLKFKIGDYSGAIADYDEILKINPEIWSEVVYNNSVTAKYKLGDYSGVIEDSNRDLENFPDDEDAFCFRAKAKYKLGDYNGAIPDFTMAIEQESGDEYLLFCYRGNAKFRLGDFNGAITDYNESIEIDPDFSDSHYNREIAKKRIKDYNGAGADFKKSLGIDSENKTVYAHQNDIKDDFIERDENVDSTTNEDIKPQFQDVSYSNKSEKLFKHEYKEINVDYTKVNNTDPEQGNTFFNRQKFKWILLIVIGVLLVTIGLVLRVKQKKERLGIGESNKSIKNESTKVVDELDKTIPIVKDSLFNTASEKAYSDSIAEGKMVKDIDGNIYKTVTIGAQVWLVENLKTTKYNDGKSIPLVTDNTAWSNLTAPGYCWYNNTEASFKNLYGALYNWYSVKTGKLCPTGWHVPTDAEWTTLTNYLTNNRYGYAYGGNANDIARSMAASGWNTNAIAGSVGNYQEGNNISGFTALPGGNRLSIGIFTMVGTLGIWYSASESNSTDVWIREIESTDSFVGRYEGSSKKNGYSVRCLKD